MKRLLTILLAALCVVGLCAPAVQARQTEAFYDPEDDKLTHLELLEKLCTGFPYVGYEKYPEPPLYFQQDYDHVSYGGLNVTIGTHGCGVSVLAMLASYMLDETWTPDQMEEKFRRYCTKSGTEFALFDDSPEVLGYTLEKRSYNWSEVYAALGQGKMVVCLQFEGNFTTEAHFILLSGVTEDGKVLVHDSNRKNHDERFVGQDVFENGFDPDFVAEDGRIYWIYGRKVVRFANCTRCADSEVETAPVFLEPYYCAKCTALRSRQSTYHEIMEDVHEKPEI